MLEGVTAVIFDLDGTLVDSMWMWRDIDIDFLRERNITFEDNIQSEIEGMSFTETASFFKNFYHLKESVEELKGIWNRMAIEKYRCNVQLKPGVLSFLEDMAKQNIKLGIATSNSMELVEIVLNAHRLRHYFSAIVTSCSVKKGKPAPDVYLETARQLGVAPKDCLVFEDIVNGLEAGIAAGMRVCGVFDEYSKDQDEKKRQLSDYYIHSYDEVSR